MNIETSSHSLDSRSDDEENFSAFSGLVELACQICDTDFAAVFICTGDEDNLVAHSGDPETLRSLYEQYRQTEAGKNALAISDDAPSLATADNTASAFACALGFALPSGGGSGTLIVADDSPKPEGLTAKQRRSLENLGSLAAAQVELRRSQAALSENASRLALFNDLISETQNLKNPAKIMLRTAEVVGEHLDLSVCAYADMDEDQNGFTITGDWSAPEASSIVGAYKLSDFGQLAEERLRAGKPLVINDIARDLPPAAAKTFLDIGIAATICMPLIKEGRLTALMAIHDAQPRQWTDEELRSLEEVVARSWAHIERVRVERTLRETTRRLNAILSNTREAVFLMDEQQQCIYANRAAEVLTGYPFEAMRGRALHDVIHNKKPDGSHYPIEECPIDRAFPERAQMSGEELFVDPDGDFYPVGFTASPVLNDDGKPIGTVIEARNIAEDLRAREHQDLLIDELNHRAKNLLAIVQGLVAQTMKSSDPDIRRALEGRLTALAAAHSLLTKRNWEPAPLHQIVVDALEPHTANQNLGISGPDLMLPSKTAVSMLLALHELATNAVKYGSLSVPEGKVDVSWTLDDDRLHFVWHESGGPRVEAPDRRGFGSRMLERGLAAELDGTVSLDFAPEGLTCSIAAPLTQAGQ